MKSTDFRLTKRTAITVMLFGSLLGVITPAINDITQVHATEQGSASGRVYTNKAEYNKAFKKYQEDLKNYQVRLTKYKQEYQQVKVANGNINQLNQQKLEDYQHAYANYKQELSNYNTVYAKYQSDLKDAQDKATNNQKLLADYQDKMNVYNDEATKFNDALDQYNQQVQSVVDSNSKADQQYADDLNAYQQAYSDYQQKVKEYNDALSNKKETIAQNAHLLAEYLESLATYNQQLQKYADELKVYNDAVDEATKVQKSNQAKENAYQKEQDKYNDELAKYNTAMDEYNQKMDTWQANKDAGKYVAFDTEEAVKNIYHYFNEYSDTVKMTQDGLTTYGTGRQETNRAYQEANNPLASNAKLKELLTAISTEDQKMGDHFKQLDSKVTWNSPTVDSIGTSESVGTSSDHSTGSRNLFEYAPSIPQELSKPADPSVVDKYLDELLATNGSFDASAAFGGQYNQIVTQEDATKYKEALKLALSQSEPQFETALTTLLKSYQTYNTSDKTKADMDTFMQDYQTFNDETAQAYISIRGSEFPMLNNGANDEPGAFLTGLKNKSAQELASDYGYLTLFMNMDYLVIQGEMHATGALSIHNNASNDADYHQKSLTAVDYADDFKPTDPMPTAPTQPTPPTYDEVPSVPNTPTKPSLPDAPNYLPEVVIPDVPAMPTLPTPPTHTELPDEPDLVAPVLPDAPVLEDVNYPTAPVVPTAPKEPSYVSLKNYPKAPKAPVAPIYKGSISNPGHKNNGGTNVSPDNGGHNTVSNGAIAGNLATGTLGANNKNTLGETAKGVNIVMGTPSGVKETAKDKLPTTGNVIHQGLFATMVAGIATLMTLLGYRKRINK